MSRASGDDAEICKPRRQTAGKEHDTLGTLAQLDWRISVPLNDDCII